MTQMCGTTCSIHEAYGIVNLYSKLRWAPHTAGAASRCMISFKPVPGWYPAVELQVENPPFVNRFPRETMGFPNLPGSSSIIEQLHDMWKCGNPQIRTSTDGMIQY